ncbi:MAG: hypothetical protein AAGA92_07605 [Planctomycetota bacterium]
MPYAAILTAAVKAAAVAVISLAAAVAAAEHPVYRIAPLEPSQVVEVPKSEIKEGLIYRYYNEKLDRSVWGIAQADGSFRYALGPGSVQPVERFDLRLTEEERSRIVNDNAPGLEGYLASTGRTPTIVLNDQLRWELVKTASISKVYDLETHRRWEWHGKRKLSVLHSSGNRWIAAGGDYAPLVDPPHLHSLSPNPAACCN